MLPRLDASNRGLAPLSAAHATLAAEAVGDTRQEAFQRALHTLLGKNVPAQVLARLSDGSFLVKVADTQARMALPPSTQAGSALELTLLSLDPRPTFQLGAGHGAELVQAWPHTGPGPMAAGLQAGAALPGKTGAGAPPAPPETTGGDDPAPTLSQAGRAIASVLSQAESQPGAPLAIIGRQPLSSEASLRPEQLARALHDNIASSGLFYESHVAQWAEGKRPLGELLREPQMREPQMREAAQAQPQHVLSHAAPAGELAAAQLINLQLHSQEQQRVLWQGEAWPGQKMQWEIQREAPGQGGGHGGDADEAAPAWRSGVRFRFPQLGEVAATLVLHGDRLQIQIEAGTDSAATLRAHAGALEQALAAAGAPLAALGIHARRDGDDAP